MKLFTAIIALVCTGASMAAMDVKASFGLMDTDMNGWTSEAEYTGLFASFDDNGDGKVDTTEFASHFSKTGLSTEGSVYIFFMIDGNDDLLLNTSEILMSFRSTDTDGDQNLSYNEYASQINSILSQLQIAGSARASLDKLFDNADVDMDGSLSTTEFWSLLSPADTDGSGMISEAEFVTYWRSNTNDNEDRAKRMFGKLNLDGGELGSDAEKAQIFNGFDYGNSMLVSKEEFEYSILNLFERVMRDVNEQLVIEFYSPNLNRRTVFDSIDSDMDSLLTEDEFAQHRNASDSNRNGVYELSEYLGYLTREGYSLRPALYQFYYLDSDSNGVLDAAELKWSFSNEDQSGDGKIDFDEFNRAINYLDYDILVAGAASPKIGSLLSASDANGDDFYTVDELKSITAAADLDGDGNIPEADFVTFWSEHTGLDELVSRQLFAAIDPDKSGISSSAERVAAFSQFDGDMSGTLTVDEFSGGLLLIYAKIMRGKLIQTALTLQGTFNVTNSFYNTDVNKDNVLTTDDTKLIFQGLDTNSDNMLSAGEFLAAYAQTGIHPQGALYLFYRLLGNNFNSDLSPQAFDDSVTALDGNDDGQVTLQEFQAAWGEILKQLAEASFAGSRTGLLFNKYDTDKTGNLTFAQFERVFNMADTNMDGLVSQAEFKENWMRATLEPADRTDFLFSSIDSDADGMFGNDQEKQSLFDAMDYGDDDLVSYDEFQNSLLNIFARSVTAAELQKAANAVVGFFF